MVADGDADLHAPRDRRNPMKFVASSRGEATVASRTLLRTRGAR
jgi:hypothetical protein